MAAFGQSYKVTVRLLRRAACAASFALITFVSPAVWAADTGETSPSVTSTPGVSKTIEVPEASLNQTDSAISDSNPALGPPTNSMPIPQAVPAEPPTSGIPWAGDPVVSYQRAQQGNPYGPGIGSAEDFLLEGEDSVLPLGIKLSPDRRRLKSGEAVTGLLVRAVTSGGPADKAGVKPYRHAARSTLEAVSVAGAFFFPPAMLLVPVLESTQIGDSYDMIIGVDGFRVTSALEFEDCMRDVQPGEIVYLSVVRDGNRLQVPVTVPSVVQ
jgi:PDZ domain